MIQLARNLKWITTTALSLALVGTACSGPTRTIEEVHFSDYVNPFIGASTNTEAAGAYHGLGKTLPRCDYPFRYGTGKSEYDYGGRQWFRI